MTPRNRCETCRAAPSRRRSFIDIDPSALIHWRRRCVDPCRGHAVSMTITSGPIHLAAHSKLFWQSQIRIDAFMNQQDKSSSQNFPIHNIVYDLMMIIVQKSKGLKAMDQYLQDAQNNQRVKES